ncbi:MAG: tetratricopeptide repeat protein [Candidatus Firestonebacteria bacterium]
MKRIFNITITLLSFIIPFSIYLVTICPTVYVGDSGEIITAAYYLGIPHPPGYPLYTMLGKIFSTLPLSNIAYRVNLTSAFFGSLTIFILFLSLSTFFTLSTFLYSQAKVCDYQTSTFASLSFAFSFSFWNQSLMAKGGLYTLNAFIMLSILYLIWIIEVTRDLKKIYPIAILCGLGLANHQTMIPLTFLFSLYLFYLIYKIDKKNIFSYLFTFFTLVTLVTLVTYLYLPIRSLANPPLDWGNPENIPNFIRHITRQQYQIVEAGQRTLSHFVSQTGGYIKAVVNQGNLLFLFFPFGVYFLFKLKKVFLILLLTIFCLTSFGFAFLTNYLLNSHDLYIMDPFFIPSYLILSILGSLGVFFLFNKFNYLNPAPSGAWAKYVLTLILLLFTVLTLKFNYFKNDKSKNTTAYTYGVNILKTVSKDGVLFVAGDNATFINAYLQKVEIKRPDLTIYDDTGNVFENIYGKDFYKLEFGDYHKRLNDVQWRLIQASKTPVYCVTGSNIYNVPSANTKSVGMLFRVLKNSNEVVEKFNVNTYDTKLFEDNSFYKDFLTREVISLFYFSLGEYCFENKDIKQAEIFYNEVEKIGSDIETVQNNLGISFIKKGFLDEAIKYCNKAVEINPKFADAFNNLGIIYYKKGLFDSAIKYYLKAIEISPIDTYFYNLGQLYRQANLPDDAVQVYERALAINPYISKAHYILGNAYLDKNELDKAIESYEKGLLIEPNSYEIYTNLGVVYDKKGSYDESIISFNKALSINPSVPETHYGLATVYFRQKDYKNSIKEYEVALKLNPKFIEAWNSLGVVMSSTGNLDGVINCYKNITLLKPLDVEAWNNLGIAYGTKGDFKTAIKSWEKALEINPNYTNARLNIQKFK